MIKVFISSVISGYENVRAAVGEAITTLGHQVIRAEDFPASPSSPQRTCLAGVREAEVVILLIGERYGYLQESGLSATHEEYREARDNKPVLAFIEQDVKWETEQEAFLQEVQSWTAGHYTKWFTTPKELQGLVTRALYEFALSNAAGPVDETEMLERAQELVLPKRHDFVTGLSLIVVGGPRQQVIRPAELDNPNLLRRMKQEAMYGAAPIFDDSQGIKSQIVGHNLTVQQPDAGIYLDEQGALRITTPVRSNRQGITDSLSMIIEEDVTDRLIKQMRYAAWLLDQIDGQHRLSDVVLIVALAGASFFGWRTRAEQLASPNQASISVSMMQGDKPVTVQLSPAHRKRAALTYDTQRIVQDLVTLLRRKMR